MTPQDPDADDFTNLTEFVPVVSIDLIVSNSGEHARNITVKVSSFLLIREFSGKGHFLCMAVDFYPLKETINNTKGEVFISK